MENNVSLESVSFTFNNFKEISQTEVLRDVNPDKIDRILKRLEVFQKDKITLGYLLIEDRNVLNSKFFTNYELAKKESMNNSNLTSINLYAFRLSEKREEAQKYFLEHLFSSWANIEDGKIINHKVEM